ncbi:oligopeptidase A-like [Paramacrobiotus metropolitanus]|uniref:oligopeptidase A-like n=1 Tax=Paramacrobiotus metropolitanus TaxID=2943436 RepID=UPI0024457BE6|nr:oligopeptidase A-like [Paramacrobiotus metropolitanus]
MIEVYRKMMKFHRKLYVIHSKLRYCANPQRRGISSSSTLRDDGYYIVLPAIPPDTAETNPLLNESGLPQFDKITDDHLVSGLKKISIDYESEFYRVEEEIQKTKQQRTFATVFDPLDRLKHKLVRTFSCASILSGVRRSPKVEEALLMSEAAVWRCLSLPSTSATILRSIKEVDREQTNLSEAQRGVLNKYLLESRLSGMELNTKDLRVYQDCIRALRTKQEEFRRNLVVTARQSTSFLPDARMLDEPPAEVMQLFYRPREDSTKDQTLSRPALSLRSASYNAFMKYCSDRTVRFQTWQALVGRAGFRDPDTNNSLVIEDIRQLRSREAKILGYDNYAALSMETKMARSMANVMNVVSEMTVPSKVKCQGELEALQKFAGENGFRHELQVWDVAYWRRRQADRDFGVKQDRIRPYFPLPHVLDGMFSLCQKLYGISIKKSDKVPVWHKDVSFYQVYNEEGQPISGFYLDPYARPDEKHTAPQVELGQNRNDAAQARPLAALIFSFMPPSGKISSLLTFDDVSALFQRFGTALQHLLTTSPYSDVSGVNNVQWDALDVSGNFMRMLLRRPEILESLSRNVNTGKTLPAETMQTLLKAENHLSSLDLLTEMYFGVLDLSLYSKPDFWQDIMKDVWRDFMPFPLEKMDAHPCGFAHIFIGDHAAAYYSFLWSEMVAADAFSALEEAGFNNSDQLMKIGRKFRDTFLSLGGSVPADEVFRRFRGRDVQSQALLRQHEIV